MANTVGKQRPVPKDVPKHLWRLVPKSVRGVLQETDAALRALVDELQAQNAELRLRLLQDSSNSSRPPSSDPPTSDQKRKERNAKRRSGRKAGGQVGHPGHSRALVPAERVDRITEHYPSECRRCGADLCKEDTSGDPVRHQVCELMDLVVTVEEDRLHRALCSRCGEQTTALLPQEVSRYCVGPKLQAVIAILSGRYRISRREVEELLHDLLGVPISVGSIQAACERTSEALVPTTELLEAQVEQAAVAHMDETGWREAGQRRWLWVVVTSTVTVFRIAASRGGKVARELLGAFRGHLVSDRWSGYNWYPILKRGLCWSHLKRDFQAIVDRGIDLPLGTALVEIEHKAMSCWHRFLEGAIDRESLGRRIRRIRPKMRRQLENARASPDTKARGLAKNLLKDFEALWTFAHVEGVRPTNNAAEQAIRPAVLWRRGSFGTRSEAGNRFVERMLTLAATAKQHGLHLLDLLEEACRGQQQGARGVLPFATALLGKGD